MACSSASGQVPSASARAVAVRVLLLLALADPAVAQVWPRIVNGTPTAGFASAGALLIYEGPWPDVAGFCSGTLIDCRTFVTAAHCVCLGADDAMTCALNGPVAPELLRVFLQHAGLFSVDSVAVHPDFSFATGGDVAVLRLGEPVDDVAPSALNLVGKPALDSTGTIVGFGRTLNVFATASDAGIKREGEVTVADCADVVPDATHVCWQFTGADSSTCSGDSGGPLFLDFGAGPVLAGVTSGGTNDTCDAPNWSFDTDVWAYADWIAEQTGDPAGDCSPAPRTGDTFTPLLTALGTLDDTGAQARFELTVPPHAGALRITLNGQLTSGFSTSIVRNDFDLYVRAGAPPTTAVYDCADLNASTFGACQHAPPNAGPWHVLVVSYQGTGLFQVTASVGSASFAPCVGDCAGDGRVTIDDLVRGINVALGYADEPARLAFDDDGDGRVTVDELLIAVTNAESGCPNASSDPA